MSVVISGDSVITSPISVGMGGGNSTTNVAAGYQALNANTTGTYNVAIGNGALLSNTVGTDNTAMGTSALYANTTGIQNIAIGRAALRYNTTGGNNTSVGSYSLYSNTASYNTAFGSTSLYSNTTGTPNDAFGYQALYNNTTGVQNTAIGFNSLTANTTGSYNVAVGYAALGAVSTGTSNTALGAGAGNNVTNLTTGTGNVLIGVNAHTSSAGAINQIVIGQSGVGQGDNYVSIGVGGTNYIYAQFTSSATWTKASDQRIKQNIKDLDIGLDFVKELKVKSYNWLPNNEYPEDIIGYSEENTQDTEVTMYGMIAQDVKAAMDKLGYEHFGGWNVREADGLQGLSNEMFVLPLINAVKELAVQNMELKQRIEALENK